MTYFVLLKVFKIIDTLPNKRTQGILKRIFEYYIKHFLYNKIS